ncbi:MAG: hypothetical protein J6S91_05160 [Treponema sp.]|nr:hypothetical protein [Treponema sp.]
MKTNETKTTKKTSVGKTSEKSTLLNAKTLAYCGYKLVGKKLVSTGTYNPVPYKGL